MKSLLCPSTDSESGSAGAYRWLVVAIFWFVYFLNQADRQVVFSVFPLLQRDLTLSNTQLGLLGSSFQWVYAALAPVGGGLGDILSRRNLIALALAVWSLATLSSGLATGFAMLLVLRALTGAGEAFYYPAANSIIADYHGRSTRAFAMSLHQTSVYAGIVCSGALAGFIGQEYGWRLAFIAFGVVGLVAALPVRRGIREPRRGQAEAALTGRPAILPLRVRLTAIFGTASVPPLMLTFLAMNFVNVACLTWMPTLLYQKFHLSLAQSGFHATFYHYLGAFLGVLLGAKLADRWSARFRLGRPSVQLAGLLGGAPFVYLMGRADSSIVVFTSLGLFGLFRGLYDSNLFASLYEVVRPEARATATGTMLAVAFLGGGSSAVAVGWLSQRIGLDAALSSTSVFYVAAAGLLLATCLFWFRRDALAVEAAVGGTGGANAA
jgi:MFS family permease